MRTVVRIGTSTAQRQRPPAAEVAHSPAQRAARGEASLASSGLDLHLSPRSAAQRRRLDAAFGPAVQRETAPDEEELQMKAQPGVAQRQGLEEEEPLQGRFETAQRQGDEEEELQMKAAPAAPAQLEAESPPPPNRSGLPDGLKSGIESLSGLSMDHVRVHYNSAQLNALAHAQGSDIHLAPGQEQHLPHEAWHVVQQAQGRVQPTMQAKGVAINGEPGPELEAEVMGAKASQMPSAAPGATGTPHQRASSLQRVSEAQGVTDGAANRIGAAGEEVRLNFLSAPTIQRQVDEDLPLQARQEDEDLPLQARRGEAAQPGEAADRPSPPGASGLPDGLRTGIESTSGLAMDQVRVHRDSPMPGRLGALAYAQGRDIHLAPGQEQHLPHEAWHVVQQAQGRVPATRGLDGGEPINDDPALEAEADRMGRQALQRVAASPRLQLQRRTMATLFGTRVVPPPVVQRVQTPALPALADIVGGEEPAVFRQHLLVLKWQMCTFKTTDPVEQTRADALNLRIDDMIANPALRVRADLDTLIVDVNALTPTALTNAAVATAPLDLGQKGELNTAITSANGHIDQATANDAVLGEVFASAPSFASPSSWLNLGAFLGLGSVNQAKTNFARIKAHLATWSAEADTRVTAATRANTGFTAYNTGTGSASKLTLSLEFLANTDALGRSRTLVHEASHGVLGTKDHGYMGAPYFFRLKDDLALDNADHYAYALQQANGGGGGAVAGHVVAANPDVERFLQAKALGYFKAQQTWLFLMWTRDAYGGSPYVGDDVLVEHGRQLGLTVDPTQPRAGYHEIRSANVQAMIELYESIKATLKTDVTVTPLGGGQDMRMVAVVGGGAGIVVPGVVGQSVEDQARLILSAVSAKCGFPVGADWDLTRVGDWLFDQIFESTDTRYLIKDTDKKLLNILRTP